MIKNTKIEGITLVIAVVSIIIAIVGIMRLN